MSALRRLAPAMGVLAGLAAILVPSPASADHRDPLGEHWNRNYPTATAVAQVYFEDFTGPAWPVYSSILEWDNRPNYIRPYYKNAGTCDDSIVHCVPVRSGNYGPDNYGGYTEFVMSTNEHFKHGSVVVRYNTYYSYGDNLRREITCHELGHAMGPLDDGTQYTGTCMKPGTPYDFGPNGHDYNILESAYNH